MQSNKSRLIAVRTVIIYAWIILATLLLASLTIICGYLSKTGNLSHLIARFWGQTILWVSGIRVFVKGQHHILPGRSYIYMANHQSNFDIPVLIAALPVQFRWLAKAELFRIPVFGRGMKGCGYISIDRSNRESAFESLNRAAATIRNGTSVLIFPEGTRSYDGRIQSFKKGGFVLTVDAGVPIIPLIIDGTRSIMPKGRKMITPCNVTLEIMAPIETTQYNRRNKDTLMDQVRLLMCKQISQIKGGDRCV